MLRKRVFLPTAGVQTPRKDFDFAGHGIQLQTKAEPFPDDESVVMGVNSFGIGETRMVAE